MTIQTGNSVPVGTLTKVGRDGPNAISTGEMFDDKKVVIFGLPGAFTPTCSEAHLPGYVNYFDQLKNLGVDTVACITVNDPFVVAAWAKAQRIENIAMLADGNADYVTALGMNVDMSARGFGVRSARFALVADNGIVSFVAQEATAKDHDVSSAKAVHSYLASKS